MSGYHTILQLIRLIIHSWLFHTRSQCCCWLFPVYLSVSQRLGTVLYHLSTQITPDTNTCQLNSMLRQQRMFISECYLQCVITFPSLTDLSVAWDTISPSSRLKAVTSRQSLYRDLDSIRSATVSLWGENRIIHYKLP